MDVGFIGLGTMGAHMARRLLQAGHNVTVHNRTRQREEPLAVLGAKRAASPSEAAAGADAVILIVSDTPDVEQVLFGAAGVASGARRGCVVVDMSTISAEATRRFGARLEKSGIRLVDAPVSGGSEGAEHGTLTIMCGGSDADVAAVHPLLQVLGRTITRIGELGSGQMCKAVNQVIVGGYYLALAEGVRLGQLSGLDMDRVLAAIGAGAAKSWVLENRAGNILRDEYPLGFRLALHRKDIGIAMDGAPGGLPLASLVSQLEDELIAAGHGDEDVSALARAVPRN